MDLNFLNMMDLSFGGPRLALGRLIGEQFGIDLGYETLAYGGSGYGALGLLSHLWGSLGLMGGLYGGGLGLLSSLYGIGLGVSVTTE